MRNAHESIFDRKRVGSLADTFVPRLIHRQFLFLLISDVCTDRLLLLVIDQTKRAQPDNWLSFPSIITFLLLVPPFAPADPARQ